MFEIFVFSFDSVVSMDWQVVHLGKHEPIAIIKQYEFQRDKNIHLMQNVTYQFTFSSKE